MQGRGFKGLCPPIWRCSECIHRVQSRHLKQFVANDSEDIQRGMGIDRSIAAALRLLRSLEVGISNRTQPGFTGAPWTTFLLRMVIAEERIGVCLLLGEDLLSGKRGAVNEVTGRLLMQRPTKNATYTENINNSTKNGPISMQITSKSS